jgi:hypothetical protein
MNQTRNNPGQGRNQQSGNRDQLDPRATDLTPDKREKPAEHPKKGDQKQGYRVPENRVEHENREAQEPARIDPHA